MSSVGGYQREVAPAGAVRLDLNEAPRDASEAFRQRFLSRLARAEWRRYPDMDGAGARRAAAALFGWEPEMTLVGNGSNELLAAAARALLPAGGRLLVMFPSFSMYPALARRQRASLLKVPLQPPDFAANREELLALAPQADLVVLASPNNPTGTSLGLEVLVALAETGVPVLWDAAYADFVGSDGSEAVRRFANVAVLRTLSKAWGLAGLRAGALYASPPLVERIGAELLPFGTGLAVQAAFETAAELRGEGERLVAEVVAERQRLLAALAPAACLQAVPSGGNFFLLRRLGWRGRELYDALAERGITVRDLKELDEAGYVRVTVGSPAENERLLAALAELAND